MSPIWLNLKQVKAYNTNMDAISDVSRGSEIFSAVPVFPPLPQPLNLDDLFGFSEAGRKKIVEETVETKYFVANKVFINQVDSFTGKHIVSLLSGKDSIQRDIKNELNLYETSENTTTKSIYENPYTRRVGKICQPHSSLEREVEYLEEISHDQKFPYDTSKLTVVEYYEMMEFESLEDRCEFIKDKLGKCYIDSDNIGSLNKESGPPPQNQTPNSGNQGCAFEIIGTLRNSKLEEISGVTNIIRITYDDPDFLKQILTCGIIIYCVNEDIEQTMEAIWVLNSLISFINEMKNTQDSNGFVFTPIFLLVSTFMTWSLTKPLSLTNELPFIEKDFRKRKPHPNYEALYELEEQLIKFQCMQLTKTAIIVSGIPYGHEEYELRYLFEKAYCYEHLPIYSHGNNLVPMVHVENLGNVIKQTLANIDYITTPFVFAKDPAQNTMADISKAISLNFGTGFCEFKPKEYAFINDMVSQDLYNKITCNIFLESCYPLFKEEDILWKCKTGFSDCVKDIVDEFIHSERIKPLRVIFYGGSQGDRLKNIALKVSQYLNIPNINPKSIICEYFEEVLGKQAKVEEQKLFSLQELQNSDSPPELIFCGDEKCIENDLEILETINIHTTDEAKLLRESDQVSIVARKLKMRPYIYHGYVMEDYPQNLEQANIMFPEKDKYISDNSSSSQIQILPNFVIFFDELKDLKNETISVQDSQLQAAEEHALRTYTISKSLEEKPLINNLDETSHAVSREVEEEKGGGGSAGINVASTNSALVDNFMLSFFSTLDEKCSAVTLYIRESDNEDEIFHKTLNAIDKCFSSYDEDVIESSSVSEPVQSVQTISKEENLMNDTVQNFKSRDDIENKNIEHLKEVEETTLAVKSYSLLSYLIHFISPTLTNGILEATAQMPQDPIDFLAKFIFINNPDGRMVPQNELKLDDMLRRQKKTVPRIGSKACLA